VPKDEPFTIPEGWRARDIDAALAAKGWIKAGAYLESARDVSAYTAVFPLPTNGTLEGYLYPETYRVVAKDDEGKPAFNVDALVQKQIDARAAQGGTSAL
jgi:UPF0755 protein